ncbi:MAG: DotU family type IV/VI secretion system protein [Desulfobacula sp.]|nr:DotU family type IV/VI secretion system protein [Desulfobacula sp.]
MRLSDCFTDLIAYVLFVLKKNQEGSPAFDLVRSDVERLNTKSKQQQESTGFSDQDYDLARFAVFAWIDEAILKSGWEGKSTWQFEQLQRKFYQTANAGELFFKNLNSIGPHQNEVREVYFLCLSLGFTGQYCNAGDELLLDQLKTSNLKLITGSSIDLPSLSKMQLFPETMISVDNTKLATKNSDRSLMQYLVFLAPAGVYGLLFLIYKFILSNMGNTIISRIP